MLPFTEKLTGTSHFEVLFCYLKAVRSLNKRVQPFVLLRIFPEQEAIRLLVAPADAPPKLMKLCKTEALRSLYNHYGGIFHVNADLYNRR